MVTKAPHYNDHPKGYECIDIIEDAPNGLLFNAFKYLWRVAWGKKGGEAEKIQDLEKVIYYVTRERDNRKCAGEQSRPKTVGMETPAPPRSNAHG